MWPRACNLANGIKGHVLRKGTLYVEDYRALNELIILPKKDSAQDLECDQHKMHKHRIESESTQQSTNQT